MDFTVSESALGSEGVISYELPNLEINIFHIRYTIIFHPSLFHFHISCLDQPGIRET